MKSPNLATLRRKLIVIDLKYQITLVTKYVVFMVTEM